MIDPAALCICGDRFDAHDPDVGYICHVWREENEAWCYCNQFVPWTRHDTGTNSVTVNLAAR